MESFFWVPIPSRYYQLRSHFNVGLTSLDDEVAIIVIVIISEVAVLFILVYTFLSLRVNRLEIPSLLNS